MEIKTTVAIERYVKNKKVEAIQKGKNELIILASDLAKEIGLKQRFPMICSAMRKCMEIDDEILHQTPSGNSSTFKVKYKLNNWLRSIAILQNKTINIIKRFLFTYF